MSLLKNIYNQKIVKIAQCNNNNNVRVTDECGSDVKCNVKLLMTSLSPLPAPLLTDGPASSILVL
jgi:hypothetical protein